MLVEESRLSPLRPLSQFGFLAACVWHTAILQSLDGGKRADARGIKVLDRLRAVTGRGYSHGTCGCRGCRTALRRLYCRPSTGCPLLQRTRYKAQSPTSEDESTRTKVWKALGVSKMQSAFWLFLFADSLAAGRRCASMRLAVGQPPPPASPTALSARAPATPSAMLPCTWCTIFLPPAVSDHSNVRPHDGPQAVPALVVGDEAAWESPQVTPFALG